MPSLAGDHPIAQLAAVARGSRVPSLVHFTIPFGGASRAAVLPATPLMGLAGAGGSGRRRGRRDRVRLRHRRRKHVHGVARLHGHFPPCFRRTVRLSAELPTAPFRKSSDIAIPHLSGTDSRKDAE